jgi:hypothetical protein
MEILANFHAQSLPKKRSSDMKQAYPYFLSQRAIYDQEEFRGTSLGY